MVPFLKTYASGLKDSASFGLDTYSDNNDVQVYSPTFELMKTVSKNWLVGVKLRVDAIAAASIRFGYSPKVGNSINAQATASKKSTFQDMRYAPTFFVTYDDGENAATVGGYYSTELDYVGKALFASYTKQLNQGNTVLGIGLSQSADKWSPNNGRVLPRDNRDERKVDLSVNQLISTTLSLQFVYSYMNSQGFLSSPYINNITENYPSTRTGHAFAVKGLKFIDDDNSMNFSYRYYTDDWGIKSHTFGTEWLHDVNNNLMIGLRGRYYTQTAANFTKPIASYTATDTYKASEYRMSAFNSYDIGIPITYKPSEYSPYKFSFSVDYYRTSDNAFIENWFGNKHIQAVYTTFRVDYDF